MKLSEQTENKSLMFGSKINLRHIASGTVLTSKVSELKSLTSSQLKSPCDMSASLMTTPCPRNVLLICRYSSLERWTSKKRLVFCSFKLSNLVIFRFQWTKVRNRTAWTWPIDLSKILSTRTSPEQRALICNNFTFYSALSIQCSCSSLALTRFRSRTIQCWWRSS